ncbi:MAG: S9 family peptidase [Candidatus Promineifilaceae bacterium]|nr:S9 family peptidase [Candidatus Promineifilaceae bacterium]
MNDPALLSLDRLFDSKEFKSRPFGPARWLDDDSGYTMLESSKENKEIKEIIQYNTLTGERTVLISVDQLQVDSGEKVLEISNFAWSSDKNFLLIFANSQRVWRQNTRGDYWLLNIKSGALHKLGGSLKARSLMFAKFAPDGRSVAYVHNKNLYVERIATGDIKQLTDDGGQAIINGTSDWVYEEEFRLRDGFCWSSDSKYIAYWQFDTKGIKPFYMINNTAALYPKLIPIPYPKAGTVNSACRIGVVPAHGGDTIWMQTPGDPRDNYIPKMEWAANSEQLLIQHLNRKQTQNTLILANIHDGSGQTILIEEDEAWVDIHSDLKWLDDGSAFSWLSERDGWRHLYRVSRDGQEITLLTPGDYDVTAVKKIDEAAGNVYFMASPDDAAQRYLFRAGLDGSGDVQRLTPAGAPGIHSYQISENASYTFHTYSRKDVAPVVSLVTLPGHQTLRVLEDNKELRQVFNAVDKQPVQFFTIDPGEGLPLDGWCIKPPDFDPQQQYPTLFYVYGEPAGQTVLDNWGKSSDLWHFMLAQQGYIVVSLDNHGTPAPKGRAWRKSVYRQVGILTTESQAAGAKAFIANRRYVDPRRVGVWGWSGGGTMTLNLMFKYPKIYKTGIAVAAVSDFRYYDTVYQERYMSTPDDNREGYKNGSPINFASQLEGDLLLIHGTADDNVHYQCHEALTNELIKHNKQFAMMSYPNRTHSIKEGKNTDRHLFTLMTRFLDTHLK